MVLPKQTPNHTHRTSGDMRASELAFLNSNYISLPYRIGKRVHVIELQNTCTLYNYKIIVCYRTTKHVRVIELQNTCTLCSSITQAHYAEQKL